MKAEINEQWVPCSAYKLDKYSVVRMINIQAINK